VNEGPRGKAFSLYALLATIKSEQCEEVHEPCLQVEFISASVFHKQASVTRCILGFI
jgi:hypothetical protein